jgi:NAD(P)-dependent dehydrogenase (short-subunit alcohol dehydrogenase family)
MVESIVKNQGGTSLNGKVALVTGSSRGIGKGVAIALGQAGATVYVTGRTVDGDVVPLPGTIDATAAEVTQAGGHGIAVRCNHGDDTQVEKLFERIRSDQGRLDILVNSASGLPTIEQLQASLGKPFWELDSSIWDVYMNVGMRSYYIASRLAAKAMVAQRAGLIVNVSSAAARMYFLSVAAGVCKAGVDKITADAAVELRAHNVSVVSIWPGLVKTERVLAMGAKGVMDLSVAETPLLSGRAVVALATDNAVAARSGQAFQVSKLAREYRFTEPDGTVPAVTNLDEVVARPPQVSD